MIYVNYVYSHSLVFDINVLWAIKVSIVNKVIMYNIKKIIIYFINDILLIANLFILIVYNLKMYEFLN